jgi:Uma2 family endonuclease
MPAAITTRRFTVDEYYRMAEVGILEPGERVELIDGQIVRMAAIGTKRAACVNRLTRLLVHVPESRALVAIQNPVRLNDLSEPEPDVTLARPRSDDYASAHPGPDDVILVIEVANTTVEFDRDVKGPLYAAAGIPEYWLVDIPGDRVAVSREPGDAGFRDVSAHPRGQGLHPVGFSDLDDPVDSILP